MKAIEEFLDALVNEGVVSDVIRPILQLRLGGQLTMQNQVSRFDVGALLRQFLNRITAILKNSGIAIDVSNAADARGGIGECRIVADQAKIALVHLNLAQIDGLNRIVLNRNLGFFTGWVVC